MNHYYVHQTLLTIGLRFNFVTNRNTQLPQIPADDSVEIADGDQEGEDYEMQPFFGKGWKITTTV